MTVPAGMNGRALMSDPHTPQDCNTNHQLVWAGRRVVQVGDLEAAVIGRHCRSHRRAAFGLVTQTPSSSMSNVET